MVKGDGCVAIHADGGAYKPLNWMNAPNTITDFGDHWVVANPKGEQLTIHLHEVLADSSHVFGDDPGLQKDGVEAHLQALLAASPHTIEAGLILVRREYPTAIGPIDLMCRDASGQVVAIEVKRRGDIDGVEQLGRYIERLHLDSSLGDISRPKPRDGVRTGGVHRGACHGVRRSRPLPPGSHETQPAPEPAVSRPGRRTCRAPRRATSHDQSRWLVG